MSEEENSPNVETHKTNGKSAAKHRARPTKQVVKAKRPAHKKKKKLEKPEKPFVDSMNPAFAQFIEQIVKAKSFCLPEGVQQPEQARRACMEVRFYAGEQDRKPESYHAKPPHDAFPM